MTRRPGRCAPRICSGSLRESTAADEEAGGKIGRLSHLMRGASARESAHTDEGEEEDGRAPGSVADEADNPFERSHQETTHNQAITREYLQRMRQATSVLEREGIEGALPSLESSPGIPAHLTERQLLRAALMLLINADVLELPELVALAEAIPAEPEG